MNKLTYRTVQIQIAEPESLAGSLNKIVDEGWTLVQILYMNNVHVLCVFSQEVTEEEGAENGTDSEGQE